MGFLVDRRTERDARVDRCFCGSNVEIGITVLSLPTVSFAGTLMFVNLGLGQRATRFAYQNQVGDNVDAIGMFCTALMGHRLDIHAGRVPWGLAGYEAKGTMFVTRVSCIAPLTITIFMRRRGINTPLLPTHRRGIVWLPPLARCLIPSQAPCPEPRLSSDESLRSSK